MRTQLPAGREHPTLTFAEVYEQNWWPMLRMATALVDDVASAEDVVQDAFAAVYRRWDHIADKDVSAGYVRVAVVNASRSALRRRRVERRHATSEPDRYVDGADHAVLARSEQSRAYAALGLLPDRQREVLVLRYLAELTDAEIAAATGLSEGGVRSAASRGLAAVRRTLAEADRGGRS